ncbi:MAG: hypothetical protein WA826_13935, partial [Silvibacterium sp.]
LGLDVHAETMVHSRIFVFSLFIQSTIGEVNTMAAFCACCGAEITPKAEACLVCGMPRHGMLPHDLLPSLDVSTETFPTPSKADQDCMDKPA